MGRKISNILPVRTNQDMSRFYKTILCGIISVSLFGCKSNNPTIKIDDFVLFSAVDKIDSVSGTSNMIPLIDKHISIPDTIVLINKISALMDSVSYYNFNKLKIEVLGIDSADNNFKTLKINLKENPGFVIPDSLGKYRSWYDFFQGSSGGQQTTIVLIESTLQRQYKGDWIDAVEFFYQDEVIGEWDHISLSGQIKRF